ncbi:hypothetical protein SDC9_149551 [bioreactor metagenome]|uniref:Uncharacterized protein n=1 Tax=bioreactor metagenome TaxID=1076179 RepID=A0A645EJX6_9ZZZZ
MPAKPNAAEHDQFPVFRQSVNIFPQAVKLDVDGVFDGPSPVFQWRAHIQQEGVFRQVFQFIHKNGPAHFLHDIARHITRHVDRILCRGKGRGVSQFQLLQVEDGKAAVHCGGQHVDPFVHPFFARDLAAEQFAGFGIEQNFYGHHSAAWVIGSIGGGINHRFLICHPVLLKACLV